MSTVEEVIQRHGTQPLAEDAAEIPADLKGHAPTETPVASMAPTIEALGSVVAGMSTSIGVAFQNMAETVNNANNLAASLNSMMESVVLRSIKIEVNVVSRANIADRRGPTIQLSVHNNNPMDLRDLKLALRITKAEEEIPAKFTKTSMNEKDCNDACLCCDTSEPNLTVGEIKADNTYRVKWDLVLPYLDQFNITTQLSVKSPVFDVTGTLLRTEHVSGIYVIHQVERCFMNGASPTKTPEVEGQGDVVQGEVSATTLRQLFEISPVDGVPIGSEFTYSTPDTRDETKRIHFAVVALGTSDASNLVLRQVRWKGNDIEHDERAFTGKRLLEEMQRLVV